MRPGDELGVWRLIELLGRGGNGEVWRAGDGGGAQAAVKILQGSKGIRLDRFKREVQFLLEHGDVPGVVPIVDYDLSGDSRHFWYSMPIATPLRRALGDDPSPNSIVEAFAALAGVLADLADRGIGHRDIKPDNLFQLDGVWAIGDFGLVNDPQADPVTAHGRKLGPIDYMAPEMREQADEADPEKADVYAFAKSLWVLLAGTNLPLPGPHRLDDVAYSLASRLQYDRSTELDALIERGTRTNPVERPQMAEVRDELQACLSPLPEQLASSADRHALARRLVALSEAARRRGGERQSMMERFNRAAGIVHDGLNRVVADLEELLATASRMTDAGSGLAFDIMPEANALHSKQGMHHLFVFEGDQEGHVVTIALAIGIRLMPDGSTLHLGAKMVVSTSWPAPREEVLVALVEETQLGSARTIEFSNAVYERMSSAVDPALKAAVQMLSAPSGESEQP